MSGSSRDDCIESCNLTENDVADGSGRPNIREDFRSEPSSTHNSGNAIAKSPTEGAPQIDWDSDTPLSEYPQKPGRESYPLPTKLTEVKIVADEPDDWANFQAVRLASNPADSHDCDTRHTQGEADDDDRVVRTGSALDLPGRGGTLAEVVNHVNPDSDPTASEISHKALCTLIRAMLDLQELLVSANIPDSERIVVEAFQRRIVALDRPSPKGNKWTFRMVQVQLAKEQELKRYLIGSLNYFALTERPSAAELPVDLLESIQDGGANSCIDDITELAINNASWRPLLREFLQWIFSVFQSACSGKLSVRPFLSETNPATSSVLRRIRRIADADESLQSTATSLIALLTDSAASPGKPRTDIQRPALPLPCLSPDSSVEIPDLPEFSQENPRVDPLGPGVEKTQSRQVIDDDRHERADLGIPGESGRDPRDGVDASDPCRQEPETALTQAIESRVGESTELTRLKPGSCDAAERSCSRSLPGALVLAASAGKDAGERQLPLSHGVQFEDRKRGRSSIEQQGSHPGADAYVTYDEVQKKRYRSCGLRGSEPVSVYRGGGERQVANPPSTARKQVTFPSVGIVDPSRAHMPQACEIVRIAPREEVAHLFSDPQDVLELDGAPEGFRVEVEENIRAPALRSVLVLHAALCVRIAEALAKKEDKEWGEPTSLVVPDPPTP